MSEITKNQQTKAEKLLEDGLVYHMGRGDTYRVKGTTGVYTVVLFSRDKWHCGCKWHTERKAACSHILAALIRQAQIS